MIGILIYISSLSGVPHALLLISFVFLIYRERKQVEQNLLMSNEFNERIRLIWIILCLTVVLSTFNLIFSSSINTDGVFSVPYFWFFVITFLAGFSLRRKDVWILAVLLCVECLIGLVQFVFDVNYFTLSGEAIQLITTDDKKSDLLYYKRVFGLSSNSSTLANKILITYLLLDFFKINNRWVKFIRVMLLAGILVTFNRTVIAVLLFYLLVNHLSALIFIKRKRVVNMLIGSIAVLGSIILLYFIVDYSEEILGQFTRYRGKIDLSGREDIWPYYYDFIRNNMLFGNGSQKLAIPIKHHAHNSYLQHIASHGALLSALMFYIIVISIRAKNYLFLGTILIYSIAQYGVFWGVSIMDMALFAFMANNERYLMQGEQ